MRGHGLQLQRGMDCATDFGMECGELPYARNLQEPGRFGRLFPELDPAKNNKFAYNPTDEAIRQVAEVMRENPDDPTLDHKSMPAGFVFLGQFVDHDITFDPVTTFEQRVDPQGVTNFRTPNLDLDSLYGAGPDASRHLYDVGTMPEHQLPYRLLLDAGRPHDLPRNSQRTALIGDPRNDENLMVSQIHLVFIKFHNAVVQWLLDNGRVPKNKPLFNKRLFEEARRTATWHYQWILVHEFLPFIVGRELVDDILKNGLRFYDLKKLKANFPFMPVEFGGATYRMGHSLLRERYSVTWRRPPMDLFDLPFFGTQRDEFDEQIQWPLFFKFPIQDPQMARQFDARVTPALFDLPFINKLQDAPASLPERNMRRGRTLQITSGQKIAEHMGETPLTNKELGLGDINLPNDEAPLWYYVLKEAELKAESQHLGPVGGRIVAEVLLGLLSMSEGNYLHDQPDWTPELHHCDSTSFNMVDLIRFAGA